MSFFNSFTTKKEPQSHAAQTESDIENAGADIPGLKNLSSQGGENHLATAAILKKLAAEAITRKQFDQALELLHEVKTLYGKHAAELNFTSEQTMALDARVHQPLAELMSQAGKHEEALAHMIYWTSVSFTVLNVQEQKVTDCFHRCKLNRVNISDVWIYIEECRAKPDFQVIQTQIQEWRTY